MSREDHFQFPGNPSLEDIYNRAKSNPAWSAVHFREDKYVQAADINDAQQVMTGRIGRVGDMVAAEGDRVSGANVVRLEEGTYLLEAGEIYVRGDVLLVQQATLEDVPEVGSVAIGVRLVSTLITHEQDADLLGLHPGTEAEGEAGAIREATSLTWGFDGDGGEGELFRVYTVINGTVIDQSPPPGLSEVTQLVAGYDSRAHGNYIASGCEVRVGTPISGNQIFSIAAGTANIQGFARFRETDIRLEIPETPDLAQVTLEAHTFVDAGGGACVFRPRRTPVATVSKVIVTKQTTEAVPRGATANTSDLLGHSSVQTVVSVVQGGTTYVAGTDYTLSGDAINWSPGGAEPATSSTYNVTYQYLEEVPVDAITAFSVTASGGLVGGLCFLSYSYKLPRQDRICLNRAGAAVYVKGVSARSPEPPPRQSDLLSLAVVTNTWIGPALVDNNGTRAMSFDGIRVMQRRLEDMLDLIALDRLQINIASREPVAKRGLFVDPFENDRWRDAGETQNAAVFFGSMQLPITPTIHHVALPAPVALSYVEEFVIRQEERTECRKVAPYISADVPPLTIEITPFQDLWTETEVTWTSGPTAEFGTGTNVRLVSVEASVQKVERDARFLRPLTIQFTIRGLGDGEAVETLTFDGIDVNPGGLVGDEDGVATGSFVIPDGVPAGRKIVSVVSETERFGATTFTGVGRVEEFVNSLKQNFERFTPQPPLVVNNTFVTNNTTVINPAPVVIVNAPVPTAPTSEWTGGVVEGEIIGGGSIGGGNPGGGVDPTAQSFVLNQARHVTSIWVHVCGVGNRAFPIFIEIVRMSDGAPTREVVAQTVVDMTSVQVGQWLRCPLQIPAWLPKDVYFAWVLRTDDPGHSISVARLGGYDEVNNKFIGSQPYVLGDMFDGSNNLSWLVHPDLDIAMRVGAAKFGPLTRTVPLGVNAATDVSDVMIRASVVSPNASCRVIFQVTFGTEPPVFVEPNQSYQRTSYFTGDVDVKMVLYGTETTSPIVGSDIYIVFGKLESTGRYVTRAGTFGVSGEESRVKAIFAASMPTGSSVTVSIDKVDDTFVEMDLASTETLADGTLEFEYQAEEWDGIDGRIEIELSGTPAARPALYDLRVWSIEEIA